MSVEPTPLALSLASLRAAAAADAAGERACNRLQALIMAVLARIFASLEDLFRLWQSGQLPPPAIRQTNPTAPGTLPATAAPAPAPRAPNPYPRSRPATPAPNGDIAPAAAPHAVSRGAATPHPWCKQTARPAPAIAHLNTPPQSASPRARPPPILFRTRSTTPPSRVLFVTSS